MEAKILQRRDEFWAVSHLVCAEACGGCFIECQQRSINTKRNVELHSSDNVFLSRRDGLLGSRYKKAVYREYVDGTFKTPKPRTDGEEHLGILGKTS